MFDVRLKENFKLFVSGPSRCGKTFFIADLLQNITKFAKQPPTLVVYIYKVWQTKFDEMRKLVHVFLKDEDDVVGRIKEYATGVPILVVFDDVRMHPRVIRQIRMESGLISHCPYKMICTKTLSLQ